MSTRAKKTVSSITLCGMAVAVSLLMRFPSDAANAKPEVLQSQVVSEDAVQVHRADWGEMRRYFSGETFGTKDVFAATGVIQPGKAIHRAHRHAEEEYLLVTAGSGVWHVAGKEFPAKTNDMLYVEPWVYHGFTNTGDEPLTFVVIKFNSKGVALPPRPDNRKDEL